MLADMGLLLESPPNQYLRGMEQATSSHSSVMRESRLPGGFQISDIFLKTDAS